MLSWERIITFPGFVIAPASNNYAPSVWAKSLSCNATWRSCICIALGMGFCENTYEERQSCSSSSLVRLPVFYVICENFPFLFLLLLSLLLCSVLFFHCFSSFHDYFFISGALDYWDSRYVTVSLLEIMVAAEAKPFNGSNDFH